MAQVSVERWQDSTADVVQGVALPLKNLEFTIDQYLLANGCWLDLETRCLLAGVRDCLGQVVCSTTHLAARES